MTQTIIVPVPTETKRDCIIGQDGKRYCEDSGEDITAAQCGMVILGCVAVMGWAAWGALRMADRDWPGWVAVLYWFGPWVALGTWLVLS